MLQNYILLSLVSLSPNEVSTLHMAPVSAGRPHVTFNNLQTEGDLLSVNQSNFEMYFDLN